MIRLNQKYVLTILKYKMDTHFIKFYDGHPFEVKEIWFELHYIEFREVDIATVTWSTVTELSVSQVTTDMFSLS